MEKQKKSEDTIEEKERKLKERLEQIHSMEQELLQKEKKIKEKEKAKKQVLLRLAPSLWNELAAWAEQDFRSINGQIEYLLTEAVRNKKKR